MCKYDFETTKKEKNAGKGAKTFFAVLSSDLKHIFPRKNNNIDYSSSLT